MILRKYKKHIKFYKYFSRKKDVAITWVLQSTLERDLFIINEWIEVVAILTKYQLY